MKKILNPFVNNVGYNCFGCSPDNPIGIKLNFLLDEMSKSVIAEWEPNPNFEGYNNVLHGGIQATLLDEIASWVVYTVLKTGGVTSQMWVRYRKPVFVDDGKIRLKAWLVKHEKKLAEIKAELYNGKGDLCAESTLQYFVYPENIAKEKFGYPGTKEFFEQDK